MAPSFGSATNSEKIVGATLLCRHATTLPSLSSPAWRRSTETVWKKSLWMSSSRVHTTLTGAPPIAFEHKAASTAKSGFDLRPKPPTQKGHVDGDVFGRERQIRGDQIMRGLRALHAGPDFGLAVDDPAGRGWRLHRRVRVVRNVVLSLDFLVRAGVSRGEVAIAAQDGARLPRGRLHLRAVALGNCKSRADHRPI